MTPAPPVIVPAAIPLAAPSAAPALEELRFRSYPSFTRIVLETTAPVSYRVETDLGGRDARIRLNGLVGNARKIDIGDGFVEEVRLERAGADAMLRVMFEGAAGELRACTLADPPRLVLDFMRPAGTTERDGRRHADAAPADRARRGPRRSRSGRHGARRAHGEGARARRHPAGGASSWSRTSSAIKVLLSRDADHFVTLRDRTSFANRERADLFVSIHANAHREAASEGVETYFLSSEATDNRRPPGGRAREQRGAAREAGGARPRAQRRREDDPVGPRAVRVPGRVVAARRESCRTR